MAIGWPTDAQLAAKLGPHVSPTDPNVASANDAAQGDAARYGPPAGTVDNSGALDPQTFEHILSLGEWYYQNRNRGPDYTAQGEYGPDDRDRTRILNRLMGRRPAVA